MRYLCALLLIGLTGARATLEPKWNLLIDPGALAVLVDGLDTATTEKGFCITSMRQITLAEPRYTPERTLVITGAFVGARQQQHADSVEFRCPDGVGIAHWHLLDRGHSPFASDKDIATASQREAGVIVFRKSREPLEYYLQLYAVVNDGMPDVVVSWPGRK